MRDDAKRKAYQRDWRARNKERIRENGKAYYRANKERLRPILRAAHVKRHYGLGAAQVDALVAAQGGRCAICRADNPGPTATWHVDHDHKTGRVRGLLCLFCNSGLGQFRDDPLRLELAAAYLRNK